MRDYEKEEERHQFSAKVEGERWQAILPIFKRSLSIQYRRLLLLLYNRFNYCVAFPNKACLSPGPKMSMGERVILPDWM